VRILLVPNTDKPAAVEAARSLSSWLKESGHTPVLVSNDAEACGLDECSVSRIEVGEPALAVALGGDGTILKAVHAMGDVDTPLLGINLGALGFLSGAEHADMREAIEGVLKGHARVERRAMLVATIVAGGREVGRHYALNEVYIGRSAPTRVVEIAVTVNRSPFASYTGDGLVVATSTGSTAYALSGGGPIVSPEVEAIIVQPIAAHTLASRGIVLSLEDRVEITCPNLRRAKVCVAVDGEQVPLRSSLDKVTVERGDRDVSLVRADGRGFLDVVQTKFFSG